MYFDKTKAIQRALDRPGGEKYSAMATDYIDQEDPRLKKNFSYAEQFHKLKDVYSLPLYAPADIMAD